MAEALSVMQLRQLVMRVRVENWMMLLSLCRMLNKRIRQILVDKCSLWQTDFLHDKNLPYFSCIPVCHLLKDTLLFCKLSRTLVDAKLIGCKILLCIKAVV